MARQYKKNRARGSRATSYVKHYEFGGYTIGKRGKSTDKAFLEQVYEQNKEAIEKKYQQKIRSIETSKMSDKLKMEELLSFKESYKTSKEFFVKKVQGYKDVTRKSMLQAIKFSIEDYFGEEVARFRHNLVKGLKTSGIYDQFLALIKPEQFVEERLNYVGDSTYEYTSIKGDKIRFVVENSPIRMIMVD